MPSKEEYFNPDSPSQSNKHWLPWLQRELLIKGILTQTPELPEAYKPDYEQWKTWFERFPVDEETILVGHSCGGGFLIRWLSENKIQINRLALVAPWINPKDPQPVPGFFDFAIDGGLVQRTAGTQLFISSDDDQDELDTAELVKSSIPGITVKEFTDRGHFTLGDMGTDEFPELRDFLLE